MRTLSRRVLTTQEKVEYIELPLHIIHKQHPISEINVLDDWVQVTTPGIDILFLNVIKYVNIVENDPCIAIEKTIRHYKNHGVQFIWQVGQTSKPDSLAEILLSRKFTLKDISIGMMVEGETFAPKLMSKNLEYCPLTEERFNDLLSIQAQAWNFPPEWLEWQTSNKWSTLALESQNFKTMLVYSEGIPAATCGYTLYQNKTMHLQRSAVVKSFRRQGIFHDMVRFRVNLARELNINIVTVHALQDTSAPIFDKMGFERLTSIKTFVSPKTD